MAEKKTSHRKDIEKCSCRFDHARAARRSRSATHARRIDKVVKIAGISACRTCAVQQTKPILPPPVFILTRVRAHEAHWRANHKCVSIRNGLNSQLVIGLIIRV